MINMGTGEYAAKYCTVGSVIFYRDNLTLIILFFVISNATGSAAKLEMGISKSI